MSPGRRRFRHINKCPTKLVFDYDGQFFCGERLNDWGPATFPDVFNGYQITEKGTKTHDLGLFPTSSGKVLDSRLPYRMNEPPVQKTGELSCYMDKSGLRSVSRLENSGEGGIVLATLREDGVTEAEMVARLPQSISSDHQASMLNIAGDQTQPARVLFLDREDRPFKRYTMQAADTTSKPAEQLPLVLHRARETIPKVVGERKANKRLPWFTGEREAKRRCIDGKSSEI